MQLFSVSLVWSGYVWVTALSDLFPEVREQHFISVDFVCFTLSRECSAVLYHLLQEGGSEGEECFKYYHAYKTNWKAKCVQPTCLWIRKGNRSKFSVVILYKKCTLQQLGISGSQIFFWVLSVPRAWSNVMKKSFFRNKTKVLIKQFS